MYGYIVTSIVVGIFIALVVHYPVSVGIRRAMECHTRLEAYLYGRHPELLDELAGDGEDPYPDVYKPSYKDAEDTKVPVLDLGDLFTDGVIPRRKVSADGTSPTSRNSLGGYASFKPSDEPSGPKSSGE